MLTLYECTASTSEYSFHANIADDIDDDQVSVWFQVGHSRFDDQMFLAGNHFFPKKPLPSPVKIWGEIWLM